MRRAFILVFFVFFFVFTLFMGKQVDGSLLRKKDVHISCNFVDKDLWVI
jgi:hypothetical protein